MAALVTVRTIEQTQPFRVPHEFGNLKDAEHGTTPRIVWVHEGGTVVSRVSTSPVEGEPVPLGVRGARYRARLRFKEKDQCELALDQLVRAVRKLSNSDRVAFDGQLYAFVTQSDGRHAEASQLLDAFCSVNVPIPAEPIGETLDVEVADTQFRAGYENPPAEPEGNTEYDVNQWTP